MVPDHVSVGAVMLSMGLQRAAPLFFGRLAILKPRTTVPVIVP